MAQRHEIISEQKEDTKKYIRGIIIKVMWNECNL